ncbi:MAG: DUF6132 family protein [Marinilabiliaceae bacterium]|jgi:hypothetical protein|nr:DUF6132 family protein [Marinilabiliaceae bacterium]
MNKFTENIFAKKNIPLLLAVLLGALGGFLYWKFIGCESGTCKIKSVWYWSTLYGAVFGYLIGDISLGIVRKFRKKSDKGSLPADQ